MAWLPPHTDLLQGITVSERDLEQDLRYNEPQRLALNVLVDHGEVAYQEFLKREGIVDFLSHDEVQHIKGNLLIPPAAAASDVNSPINGNCSSDGSCTYWPTVSDVMVPDLELGWPLPCLASRPHGQTNVTLYAQPPLGEGVPTIKQVVRRMLRQATEVIAIVMDVFSDVDIFRDLIDVASIRKVPVYIVLDIIGFPAFRDMCDRCGVTSSNLENMRVRVVRGSTYCCQTGTKFHGRVFEKFLLVDCKVALCGSYSFTWSYEKINRSIVQVFTGQVVDIFDEEFRILYGESDAADSICSPSLDVAQRCNTRDHPSQPDKNMQDARTRRIVHSSSYQGSRNPYSSIMSRTADESIVSDDKDFLSHDRVQARVKWLQEQQPECEYGTPDKFSVLFRNQRTSGARQDERSTSNAWKRHSHAGEILESSSIFQRSKMIFESRDQGEIRRISNSHENTAAEIREPARYGRGCLQDTDSQKFRGTAFIRQKQSSLLLKGSNEGSVVEKKHGEIWNRHKSRELTTHRGSDNLSKLSSSPKEVTESLQFLSSVGKSEGKSSGRLCGTPPQLHEQSWNIGKHVNTRRQGMATNINWDQEETLPQIRASMYFDKRSSNEEGKTSGVNGVDANYSEKFHTITAKTTKGKTTQEISNGNYQFMLERKSWFRASMPLISMYKSKYAADINDNATMSQGSAARTFSKYASQVSLKHGDNSENTSADHKTHSVEQALLVPRLMTTSKDQVKQKETSNSPFFRAIGGLDHGQRNHQQTTSMNDLMSKAATRSDNHGTPAEPSCELSSRTLSMSSFVEAGPHEPSQRSTKQKRSSLGQDGKKDESAMENLKRSLRFRSLFYFSPDKGYEHCLNEAAQRMDDARSNKLVATREERNSSKSSQRSKGSSLPYTDSSSQSEHVSTSSTPASAGMNGSPVPHNVDISTISCLVNTEAPDMTPMPVCGLSTETSASEGPGEVRPESNSSGGASRRESLVSEALEEVAPKAVDMTPSDVELTHTRAQELTPRAEEPGAKEAELDAAWPEAANNSNELRSQELLQKIESMRREKRPYSLFELFYKSDDEDAEKAVAVAVAPAARPTRPAWQPTFDVDCRGGGAPSTDYNRPTRHGSLSRRSTTLGTGDRGGGGGGEFGGGDGTTRRVTTQQLLQQRHLPPAHLSADRQKEERRLSKLMQRFALTFKSKNK